MRSPKDVRCTHQYPIRRYQHHRYQYRPQDAGPVAPTHPSPSISATIIPALLDRWQHLPPPTPHTARRSVAIYEACYKFGRQRAVATPDPGEGGMIGTDVKGGDIDW